jgi:adenosylmethionine-8-amino-7-oxononanoate aminotransferase
MLIVSHSVSYQQVQAIVKKYDILFIADEVFVTFY